MAIASYDELMALVQDRAKDTLTLEVDLGGEYSEAHEKAKRRLAEVRLMDAALSGQGFLGTDIKVLEAEVEATRPAGTPVFVRYSRVSPTAWAGLMKKVGLNPADQYEEVLSSCFVGVYGDPAGQPLSTDTNLVSSKSDKLILTGGQLQAVISAFSSWQTAGGEVNIRPTK